jgi:hypothetical protein
VSYNERSPVLSLGCVALSVAATCFIFPSTSLAKEIDEPPLAIAARETFDLFDVSKGIDPGTAVLNKIQLSGSIRGDQFGLRGWSLHGQLFRFDGQSLSRRLGDIQTADNIEAAPVTRSRPT